MTDKLPPLLPCPFCGDDMSSFVPAEDGCARGPGLLYVTCDCDAMGPGGKTVGDAIAAWNRRQGAEEAVRLEREAILALLDEDMTPGCEYSQGEAAAHTEIAKAIRSRSEEVKG